jgi:3-hydroxyacyl-CoA dehydrogenase/enoyl-CoA hydratase/3-hydroxybutyryl-CoA epimerase
VKSLTGLCRDKHKSSIEIRDTLDRLIPDPDARTLGNADLVIEAVPENVELKQKIYQQVEPRLKETAILATNTSSIPLPELASFLSNPARLVGIHFFNPVARMLVVEVVSHDKISEQVQQQAMAFTAAIGRLPVPVQSYPGFLVNRALTPYLQEAMMMLDEGLPAERIDQLARDFGMPMGPIELADQVGLDICLHVADVLNNQLDKPMATVPDWLREKVEKGQLGKKSGQGFYQWKDGRAQKGKSPEAGSGNRAENDRLTDRLLLPLLNACIECWRENVVADLDQLDAAMIFATGFAPFRGGPMHYAKHRGVGDIVAVLASLATEHGERFKPDDGWKAL